jgi:hypothetical protein
MKTPQYMNHAMADHFGMVYPMPSVVYLAARVGRLLRRSDARLPVGTSSTHFKSGMGKTAITLQEFGK